jgi:4-diphosphocytidyl-2-C-methyl-D-erythritol kinase
MTLVVTAPAKINLSLRVGSPQSDGRHPLDSLVCFTRTCGDTLAIAPADAMSLTIEGPFAQGLSDDETNLVLRAARLLSQKTGVSKGAAITLTKALPVASGIGGGSADAAAALIGLNQLWGTGASADQLQSWSSALGADVPACVLGQNLRMTGTGETIAKLRPLPRLGILLVNPLVACPTGSVFQKYDEFGTFCQIDLAPLPDLNSPSSLLRYLRATPNDLEAPACALVPEISGVLCALNETPHVLMARMSGSGATCFGLYPTLEDAAVAGVCIKNKLASAPIWVEADEIS